MAVVAPPPVPAGDDSDYVAAPLDKRAPSGPLEQCDGAPLGAHFGCSLGADAEGGKTATYGHFYVCPIIDSRQNTLASAALAAPVAGMDA